MDPEGGHLTRLTNSPGVDDYPTWSPDGERIAYSSERDGHWEIVSADLGSGLETALTQGPSFDFWPVWSPDGSKIAFTRAATFSLEDDREICVMDADGGKLLNLSQNPAKDQWPVWSPDGTRVVFYSNRDGRTELYMANADGSGLRRLTQSAKEVRSFAIAPK